MVLVGLVARPHGLRGHVVVQPETDFAGDRFGLGANLYYAADPASGVPRRLTVKESRWQAGRLIVLFDGLGTVEEAEALGRGELRVEPDALRPLPPGQFYHHDLVGCDVETVRGERVGRVAKVEEFGSATLLVRGPRGEVLIPLAAEICVEIDVAARRIVVAAPDGLLDANR
jgi:16S rRNA processing protein RimM